MNRTIALPVVLAALVTVVLAPLAIAKLPPGTTFEACGESGCTTASDDASFQLQLKLIEPAMEHGTAVPPSGAQPWLRVDVNVAPTRGLRSLLRNFPVVFAPEAGYIGVPGEEGTYRWVMLRGKRSGAYVQLAEGLRPFPPQTLADLDPASVARANPDTAGTTSTEGDGVTASTLLIMLLAILGLLLGVGVVARARQARHLPAE